MDLLLSFAFNLFASTRRRISTVITATFRNTSTDKMVSADIRSEALGALPPLTTYSINHEATIDLDSSNAFEGDFMCLGL